MSTKTKNKISARARFVKACIHAMASNQLFGTQIQTGELQKKIVEPEWKCPDGYSLSKIDMRHFGMEWLAPAEVGDQVVLQLHGGGYINRLRNIYRDFAVKYSGMAEGLPVLSVDYRVAPEHPYPAALLDAIEAYRWLLELGYSGEQIIVVGDSAGGGLALALSMWLRDQDMSLPGKLVLMSPWADLTASGKSYEENYHQDPMFGGSRETMIYLGVYPGEHDPMEPYISPLFGNFRGLPPMLLQAGSIEMLRSDAESVAGKAGQAGCRVSLTVYPEMFHVFQMGLDHFPESKTAWEEVQRFIEI